MVIDISQTGTNFADRLQDREGKGKYGTGVSRRECMENKKQLTLTEEACEFIWRDRQDEVWPLQGYNV